MNNLKAERTLTAELIAAAQNVYDKLASETATVTIFDQERLGDALRSQSLSTQQPMGEVTDEMVERASKAMDEKFSEAFLDVWPDWDGLARLALNAALHPNQESGE